MIKLQVIGHLGRDCTENDVNGNHVINFVVAHSSRYKDVEKTIWVDCAYWTDRIGIVPYLKKGASVYVEGTPDVRSYQTNDGRQAATLTLRVSNIQLLGSGNRTETNSGTSTPAPSTLAPNMEEEADDDLPF